MANNTEQEEVLLSENSKSIIDIDVLTSKHRKERKELQSKIQALKKNAPKSDKKKRKEVLEEISRLEADLEKRHAQQLNDAESMEKKEVESQAEHINMEYLNIEDDGSESDTGTSTLKSNNQRISKAQKRRDKKSRDAKSREAEIQAAQEDNKNGPKALESCAIDKILKERNLYLHMIPSDGDCLYNAIKHQLELTNHGLYSVAQLRQLAAKYILDNKDALIYYMTNPNTGDVLTDGEFVEYCENICNSPSWGGQIEINALSSALKVPIEVLQGSGPPTLQGAEEFLEPILTITYHRHMYSLGEHYNSTKSRMGVESDEEETFAEV